MMFLFPPVAPLRWGSVTTGKAQPYGLLCFNWPRGALIGLNSPAGDVINELHDFWNHLRNLFKSDDAKSDLVKIGRHPTMNAIVPNEAVNLTHVINCFGTCFNGNGAFSG